jgi:hypothetical protein
VQRRIERDITIESFFAEFVFDAHSYKWTGAIVGLRSGAGLLGDQGTGCHDFHGEISPATVTSLFGFDGG